MDGITTCATRLLTKEIFDHYGNVDDTFQLWTEFMNVDGFLINPEKVVRHLQTTPGQLPLAQIYGGNEETLVEAAMKIEREYGERFS
jgi:tRNA-dihydrouridine synthase